MPKPRKYQLVQCQFFVWRLIQRDGVLYADGRSNKPNLGKHSLNTRDVEEARKQLVQLDLHQAVKLGLAKPTALVAEPGRPLPLVIGRQLYEQHIKRPIVAGGVKESTAKRYRAVFDKFVPFAQSQGVSTWTGVVLGLLNAYASNLDKKNYASKTIRNEMVTVVQAQKWLIAAKHLVGCEPIKLQLRKVESEKPYCYTTEQVAAMVMFCRSKPELAWMVGVIIALATTGLRIAELAGLRWADIDLVSANLKLTDETGRPADKDKRRRQLKSGRSRSLPLHHDLAEALAAISHIDAYVFHGPRGGRLKPDTVRQVLVREVLSPLSERFPTQAGEKGFADGRLHSFRHYFASFSSNNGTPERMVMDWLGHADSEMVRHYYHLHDSEAQRQMRRLDLLGAAGQQLPGINGAANNTKEATGQESDPKIAT